LRIRAVVNPRAGLAAHRAIAALERARSRPFWQGLEVSVTERRGHATELTRDAVAAGADLVLAVGGDGTVNEVALGLQGSPATLGLVPVGSGNGLARGLLVPLRPDAALQVVEDGVACPLDVGLVNGRPFLNVAGVGLDADVGAAFQARGERGGRRGVLPYVLLAARRALHYRARRWTVEADGQAWSGRALFLVFANGRQYGAGAVIAPGARLDDGVIDLVIVEDTSVASLLFNWPRLFTGSIERYRPYRRLAVTRAVVTGDGPFIHHRDGEPMPEAGSLELGVTPRALNVLVPRRTAGDPTGPLAGAAAPGARP
jgi:YegS/Rv2252/BmrU family lipid kinase